MTSTAKVRALFLLALSAMLLMTVAALADPCLIVYPQAASKYHYDVNEYYTVSFGHPLYDSQYDRGGECFSAFSHDSTVPVSEATWGSIKSLYSE